MAPTRWVSCYRPAWNISSLQITQHCAASFASSPQGQPSTLPDCACSPCLSCLFEQSHLDACCASSLSPWQVSEWLGSAPCDSAGTGASQFDAGTRPNLLFCHLTPLYICHLPLHVLQHDEMDFGCDGALQVLTAFNHCINIHSVNWAVYFCWIDCPR